jgi:excinuclease ABC subunit C
MIKLTRLPTDSGCYIYKDKEGRIIYIGKAKNLKKRISSYFQKKNYDTKTVALVKNIDSVDFIITNNEIEALILENNLIKKHQPRYNINLKDSKRYAYIQKTDEDFPKFIIARKIIESNKGKFFGPFTSGEERDNLVKLLNKLFMLRTCKKMPKRPCLRYHLKLCSAPCSIISKKEYLEQINKAAKVLSGNTSELIIELKLEMKSASAEQNYEKARLIRDQLSALNHLNEKQNMERQKRYNEDILNYIIRDGKIYLILFNIYKGTLINKQEFIFDYNPDFLNEFIMQYYSGISADGIPKELIVPEKIDESIKDFFEQKNKTEIDIIIPKIGEKKQLLELVKKNIEITFFGDISKVEELKIKLKLNDSPNVIECFDISHISGTSMVGSMVQFRNGKADKTNYCRFKIKTVNQVDDFASIAEVIKRRYSRLKKEKKDMPDLIVIDGGKGQLSSAMHELEALGLKIPTISIAKKQEEIYFPGSKFPLTLDRKEKALKYIQEIRDEAHRFAIKYNRLLRSKRSLDNPS